jgi:ribosome-binding protein aMBF1 (putative translation factor)
MSKFIFTGCLLLLLASFLNYPAQSVSTKSNAAQESRVIFPISEQIKLARMEKQITAKELANRVGLTKMSVEKIEKGQLVPTHEILEKLEVELGTQFNLNGY